LSETGIRRRAKIFPAFFVCGAGKIQKSLYHKAKFLRKISLRSCIRYCRNIDCPNIKICEKMKSSCQFRQMDLKCLVSQLEVSMKRFTVAFLIIFVLTVSAAYAQRRVKFPTGKNSVTLKGKTTGGPSESGGMNPVSYKFWAKKGQQLTLKLTSAKGNAVFAVYLPQMSDFLTDSQDKTTWNGTLPKTGDYEIIIFPEDEMTNTLYTLIITIK
jgi:hypothetical protein